MWCTCLVVAAELVNDVVKAAYPQTVTVQQPQLANARGYLNYALFTANQTNSELCEPGALA